jgi:hypothetical protein
MALNIGDAVKIGAFTDRPALNLTDPTGVIVDIKSSGIVLVKHDLSKSIVRWTPDYVFAI